ncbi:unnamed protein product [Pneumocystis jirovecii]|uniref:Uncharacterized protein n=2 Tax=Pneumocystis jirovecii TaxID=42068 RepID=L0PG92_PNEJI|nr:uncharacterized protein T551_03038 [Pneumocystis jirovecii RU7]KTW27539.1 hypothetical protein T551_03038 [Pneumocystis jirovecii RU7]CCJ31094.1 unnamed protein product [Pneumocystis jirovecii]
MKWIFIAIYILPTCLGFFKQNEEAKSNCYGSIMCGLSMLGNCWQAIEKYEDSKQYSGYTSRTESGFGYGSGCTIIFTCEDKPYVTITGKEIKDRAGGIVKKCGEDPGIPCGSEYINRVEDKCRVTVNYCAECYDRG